MVHLSKKKILFTSVVIFCFASVFMVPAVHGAPASIPLAATTLDLGTYSDIMPVGQSEGYYNVTFQEGTVLRVRITYSLLGGRHLSLYLQNPTGDAVADDQTSDGDLSVVVTLNSTKMHMIYIVQLPGPPVGTTYTITLELAVIPGFEICLVLFSVGALLGLVMSQKRRKFL